MFWEYILEFAMEMGYLLTWDSIGENWLRAGLWLTVLFIELEREHEVPNADNNQELLAARLRSG